MKEVTTTENQVYNPLVSIIVITYNSSKFVLETLESVKTQTYQNIELVISDDASQDDTVAICRNWLEENKERFVRTELVTVKENTGISANCNRGLGASQGEWIKLIAGDDILEDQSIQFYIDFTKNNPESKAIFGITSYFTDTYKTRKIIDIRPSESNQFFFEKLSSEQLSFLTKKHFHYLEAPAFFIEKKMLVKIHGFDETYRAFEDYPLFLTILENGNKLFLLPKNCVLKRIYKGSVSNFHKTNNKIITQYELDTIKYKFLRISKYKNLFIRIDFFVFYIISIIIIRLGNNGVFLKFLFDKIWVFSPNSFIQGIKFKLQNEKT